MEEVTEQQRAATDQLQAEVSKWQNAAEEARPSLAPSWFEDENDIFFKCTFYILLSQIFPLPIANYPSLVHISLYLHGVSNNKYIYIQRRIYGTPPCVEI